MTKQFHKEEQTYSSQNQFTKFDVRAKIKTAFVDESQKISRDNFLTFPSHDLILHQ